MGYSKQQSLFAVQTLIDVIALFSGRITGIFTFFLKIISGIIIGFTDGIASVVQIFPRAVSRSWFVIEGFVGTLFDSVAGMDSRAESILSSGLSWQAASRPRLAISRAVTQSFFISFSK